MEDNTGWAMDEDQLYTKTCRDLYDLRTIVDLWIQQIGFPPKIEGTPVFYRSNENEKYKLAIDTINRN